ncbi:hypothetical protein ACJIZ3_020636 [Penstemon smallii]|uniref:Uncharacterized protein n=1 Tax=Penstemon smallii TaxID=265156 RepID=A0ABD3SJE0_9LAMI
MRIRPSHVAAGRTGIPCRLNVDRKDSAKIDLSRL